MRTRNLRTCLVVSPLACVLISAGCDWESSIESALESLDDIAAERPEGSAIESIVEGNATQIYYQYTDDRNQVRFVTSLELVPEAWRDRVGYVELPSAPPMTPRDAQRANAITARATGSGPGIILYAADWCMACRSAKKYMNSEGIAYQERNVDEPSNQEMLREVSGALSIPVFDINGKILSGFNPQKLDQLIAAAS